MKRLFKLFILALLIAAASCSFAFAAIATDKYTYCPVYFNGTKTSYTACTIKGNVYMTVSDLKKIADFSSFTLNNDKSRLEIEPAKLDMLIGDTVVTDFIKRYAGTCSVPYKAIEGKQYLSVNLVGDLVGLDWSEKSDVVYIETSSGNKNLGTLANAKAAGSIVDGSGENFVLEGGVTASIVGQTKSFYKLRSADGNVFYANKEDFKPDQQTERSYDYIYSKRNKWTPDGQFNASWVYVESGYMITPLAPSVKGLDVVCPTWFQQKVNGGGDIRNCADRGYTDLCHEKGYQVWATINNSMSTSGSTNYTSKVLADDALRRKTIAQYLFYSCLYDVDGINIDYEDLFNEGDGALFSAFVKEFRTYTERLGMVLSVDTLTPESYNLKAYDFEALQAATDYVCVMTYDEHYTGSTYAGSVSDKPFYSGAIEKCLQWVPAEKLMMCVPFYTRVWTVDANNRNLGVSTITMKRAAEIVAEKGLSPKWLEDMGQNYVEYSDNGKLKKCWLEDTRSIEERVKTALKYGLAGTSCWQYSQAVDEVWAIFAKYYK